MRPVLFPYEQPNNRTLQPFIPSSINFLHHQKKLKNQYNISMKPDSSIGRNIIPLGICSCMIILLYTHDYMIIIIILIFAHQLVHPYRTVSV